MSIIDMQPVKFGFFLNELSYLGTYINFIEYQVLLGDQTNIWLRFRSLMLISVL